MNENNVPLRRIPKRPPIPKRASIPINTSENTTGDKPVDFLSDFMGTKEEEELPIMNKETISKNKKEIDNDLALLDDVLNIDNQKKVVEPIIEPDNEDLTEPVIDNSVDNFDIIENENVVLEDFQTIELSDLEIANLDNELGLNEIDDIPLLHVSEVNDTEDDYDSQQPLKAPLREDNVLVDKTPMDSDKNSLEGESEISIDDLDLAKLSIDEIEKLLLLSEDNNDSDENDSENIVLDNNDSDENESENIVIDENDSINENNVLDDDALNELESMSDEEFQKFINESMVDDDEKDFESIEQGSVFYPLGIQEEDDAQNSSTIIGEKEDDDDWYQDVEEDNQEVGEQKPKTNRLKNKFDFIKSQVQAEYRGEEIPDGVDDSDSLDNVPPTVEEPFAKKPVKKNSNNKGSNVSPMKNSGVFKIFRRVLSPFTKLYTLLINVSFTLIKGFLGMLSSLPIIGNFVKPLLGFTKVLESVAKGLPFVFFIVLVLVTYYYGAPSSSTIDLPDEVKVKMSNIDYDKSNGLVSAKLENISEVNVDVLPSFEVVSYQPSLMNVKSWFLPQSNDITCFSEIVNLDINTVVNVNAQCEIANSGFLPRVRGSVE